MKRLLKRLAQPDCLPLPHRVALRALEAGEKAGTPPARKLLARLAGGGKGKEVANAARLALRRLEARPTAP